MHISQFNKPNPRNLTGGDGYMVDLGLVNLRDAAIYGRTRPLIPYEEGRLICGIRFVPGGTATTGSVSIVTPNTAQGNGAFALIGAEMRDTIGLFQAPDCVGLTADNGPLQTTENNQILDCGPLIAISSGRASLGSWQANTPVCAFDAILDSNDHIQSVSVNGVTGSSEPTWNNSGGTTSDGTVTWQDVGLIEASGEIHLVVEVIEGISPMPQYPATLEFIAQPQDAEAEATLDPITVILKNQFGTPYTLYQHSVNLSIFGAGTLVGTVDVAIDAVTGIASFDDLSITEPASDYILRAQLSVVVPADPIFSDPFDITAP